MAGVGGWAILARIFLPLPLVLTALLILPAPRNVRKGVLQAVHRVLNFSMIGGLKLVKFSLIVSGIPLIDGIFKSARASRDAHGVDLRPEVKVALMGKKWREERNFWLAACTMLVWCLLSVINYLVTKVTALEEQVDSLRDDLADAKGEPRPSAVAAAAAKASTLTRRAARAAKAE